MVDVPTGDQVNLGSDETVRCEKKSEAKEKSGGGDDKKRKQPPFLERAVEVKKAERIEYTKLLNRMQGRFDAGYVKWKKQSKYFKLANFIITLVVIVLQVAQVIVFQFPHIDPAVKSAVATILPAVTGAILSIQLKLSWAEKGTKCKKAAQLYHKLHNHIQYRSEMTDAGGELIDAAKIWNAALLNESREVPAFMSAY